jgi:predicted DCC family thiol-disulfide oxidoreductase YuxK
MREGDGPILLYDAECGFCSRVVQFVLRHERRRPTLRFARLRGAFAERVRAQIPILATVDSMVWVERGVAGAEVFVRSEAAIRVAAYLGGLWALGAWFGAIVPRGLRDAIYDVIARHRHAVSVEDCCDIPDDTLRARLID